MNVVDMEFKLNEKVSGGQLKCPVCGSRDISYDEKTHLVTTSDGNRVVVTPSGFELARSVCLKCGYVMLFDYNILFNNVFVDNRNKK